MSRFLVFFVLFAGVFCEEEFSFDATQMYNASLIEGDILPHPIAGRAGETSGFLYNAITNPSLLWPGGEMVYFLDQSVSHLGNIIQQAMNHISSNSCIRFRQYYNGAPSYVHFQRLNGCFSHVGKTGGGQPLSLGPGCERVGIAIHEILHALGFHHHHSRSDRDQYLRVNTNNVDPQIRFNFNKLQPYENTLYTQFDYGSIMMYGSYAFSNNRQPTMTPIQAGVRIADPGEKGGMTQMDFVALNRLYNCRQG